MPKTVVYSLKREMHLAQEKHYPTLMRQWIRNREMAISKGDIYATADATQKLMDLFIETSDWGKTVNYAEALLKIALKISGKQGMEMEMK
jgi:hypothetical protein